MKSLKEYLQECEGATAAGVATAANTMGLGDPSIAVDGLVSAPLGGIPHQTTKIHRRKKRKKNPLGEFDMKNDK